VNLKNTIIMDKYFHQITMGLIVVGALVLLYLSAVWFTRDNIIMGVGMLVMSIIAFSNFYLHLRMMKRGKL